MYKEKICRFCKQPFTPEYSNQRYHHKCKRAWRRDYEQKYHRDYQRKVRKELKEDWAQEIDQ
jgi:hypothetical protein